MYWFQSMKIDILGSEIPYILGSAKCFMWYKLKKCNGTLIPKFVFCESLNF